MRVLILVGLALSLSLPATSAQALQLGSLLIGKMGPVDAKYRKGNLIRAHASLGRDRSPSEAYRLAMAKIAELAQAKGYVRVGVTKVSDCGTLMMNGTIAVAHSCRILAQMVGPDEAAKPEGNNKVIYFSVPELLAGTIRPEGAALVKLPLQ